MSFGAALYLLWAVASVAVYSVVLGLAIEQLGRHPGRRSRRELYIYAALFMAACASLGGVTLALMGHEPILRLGTTALALGAFLGAGIIIALELLWRRREEHR